MDALSETEHKTEEWRLKALIERKIKGVPEGVLPIVTLDKVLEQSADLVCVDNIPADLQLHFYLTHYAEIASNGRVAIKDETIQRLDITRAIFFYRIDDKHQFQRYHDSHRWNAAIFLALLSLPPSTSTGKRISPAGRHFMTTYLDAVYEHHAFTESFESREEFVRLWKASNIDFFIDLGAAHRKRLKWELKRLTRDWEKELDRRIKDSGRDDYDKRIAGLVGILMPGRKDQIAEWRRIPPPALPCTVDLPKGALLEALRVPAENEGSRMDGLEETVSMPIGHEGSEKSEPDAEAPRVPSENKGSARGKLATETITVTSVSDAIWAVQRATPAEMLGMLGNLYPIIRYGLNEKTPVFYRNNTTHFPKFEPAMPPAAPAFASSDLMD